MIRIERLPPEMSGLPWEIRITGTADELSEYVKMIQKKIIAINANDH